MGNEEFFEKDRRLYPELPEVILQFAHLVTPYAVVHQNLVLNELGALDYIVKHPDAPFDTSTLHEIFRVLAKNSQLEWTGLRRRDITMESEDKSLATVPAPSAEIQDRLDSLFDEFSHLNNPASDSFDDILKVYLNLLAIHAVENGNGRLSLIMMQLLLQKAGLRCAPYLPLDTVLNWMNRDGLAKHLKYAYGPIYGVHPMRYEKILPYLRSALRVSYRYLEDIVSRYSTYLSERNEGPNGY